MPRTSNLRVAPDDCARMQPTLCTLAAELTAARETALDLQITVGEIVASLGQTSCDAIFRLQDLDRLAQTLGDLATFTGAIARSVPETWCVDAGAASGTLHLRDLASRLSGAAAGNATDLEPDIDDFLLFTR